MTDIQGQSAAAGLPTSYSPMQVLGEAARATGANFDFLVRTAAKESNFDAGAKAATSSAAGLFQFIEQTWMAMIARHGDEHGFGEQAAKVSQSPDGRYRIDDPDARREILDMRFDPRAAAVMAGELAAENGAQMRASIGREPTSEELYLAHFLGARGASRLINTAEINPDANAADMFPAAARANRPIFYDGGRPRTAAQVIDRLTGQAGEASAPERAPGRARSAEDVAQSFVRGAADAGERIAAVAERVAGTERRGGVAGYAAMAGPGAVLSPGVVELLASLGAPEKAANRGRS